MKGGEQEKCIVKVTTSKMKYDINFLNDLYSKRIKIISEIVKRNLLKNLL